MVFLYSLQNRENIFFLRLLRSEEKVKDGLSSLMKQQPFENLNLCLKSADPLFSSKLDRMLLEWSSRNNHLEILIQHSNFLNCGVIPTDEHFSSRILCYTKNKTSPTLSIIYIFWKEICWSKGRDFLKMDFLK